MKRDRTPQEFGGKAVRAKATPLKAQAPRRQAKVVQPSRNRAPTLAWERTLWESGKRYVVGVDEVGRGAWAGPIMVGAAILPQERRVYRVRDSKMLTEPQRERLFDRIAEWCVAWGVGAASQEECDGLGMAAAQRLAAGRAIEQLGVAPEHVLLDGRWDFVGLRPVERIVKGDATCLSIAAASILAKVTRDRYMRWESPSYPVWEFDSNKGYPCPRHKMALQAYGPSAIHRRTWIFMEHLPWGVAGARAARRPWLETLEELERLDELEGPDEEIAEHDPEQDGVAL